MAEPYDVLASLNRMLESEERREETKLQSSLALMQFAQQKRMADIQLAGQQLELLQAANSQMMGSQAQSFLIDSGLDAMYLGTFDESNPEDGPKDMATALTKGDWKLSSQEANRVVGAVYASKSGQHSGVLKIGSDLSSAIRFGESSSISQQNLLNKFAKAAPSINEDALSSMDKTVSNQRKIVEEMFNFGQGDYDISTDITMEDIEQSSLEDIDDSLVRLSEESEGAEGQGIIGENEIVSMSSGLNVSQQVKKFDEEIKELSSEVSGQYQDMVNLENQKRLIKSKEFAGLSINQSEEDFLNRTSQMKALSEAEVLSLNSKIKEIRKEQRKYKIAKFANNPIPGMEMKKGTLLDDEEIFIGGIGGSSGRMY